MIKVSKTWFWHPKRAQKWPKNKNFAKWTGNSWSPPKKTLKTSTNTTIFTKVNFGPIWPQMARNGHAQAFLAITRERRFCWTCGFHQKIELVNTFRLNIIWTTSSCLDFLQKCIKSEKKSFLGYFGPFMPKYGQMGGFAEKSGSVTFFPLWSPNIMEKIRKK